jgi:transcriptional regulator with XRE-family HTH domain
MDKVTTLLTRARDRKALRADPEFGRRVREDAGLTIAAVAELMRVDTSTVSRWETGERVPRGTLASRYRALLARLHREGGDGVSA